MGGQEYTGKTALVTGAASGIGLATAERLAGRGVRVALNHLAGDGRGPAEIERLRGLGFEVVGVPGDVSDPADASRMVAQALDALGRLDGLVNNAGTSATAAPVPPADLDRMDEPFWATILSTNLIGPFRCVRAAAPALRATGGAIVNTASIAGLTKMGSSIAYGASKAGLINMTQNLARGLAPDVRVNAVAPGFVASPWTAEWPKDRIDAIVESTPLRRACTPDDIAGTIVFLLLDAPMITGQTIVVDGGLMMGM